MRLPLPRSLFARLMLIWLVGIALVLAVSLALFVGERERIGRSALFEGVAQEIATVADLLDSMSPPERERWIDEIGRRRLRLALAPAPRSPASARRGPPPAGRPARGDAAAPGDAVHPSARRPPPPRPGDRARARRRHPAAGAPAGHPAGSRRSCRISPGACLAALAALVAGVGLLTWIAVRIATRPLSRMAEAARALGEDPTRAPMDTRGPTEVAQAAAAFNQMQQRIAEHVAERTRILAAISHDLQTPITRLRLRAEMVDDEGLRARIQSDLDAMQGLVKEGSGLRAQPGRTQPGAGDRARPPAAGRAEDARDMGWTVRVPADAQGRIVGNPAALRRALWNLIENGVKFGGEVELALTCAGGRCEIRVRDHGPGLAEDELEKVFEPFYRTEASRNRETGGTGLGLAITRNLLHAQGGEVALRNHPEGGLEAVRCGCARSSARRARGRRRARPRAAARSSPVRRDDVGHRRRRRRGRRGIEEERAAAAREHVLDGEREVLAQRAPHRRGAGQQAGRKPRGRARQGRVAARLPRLRARGAHRSRAPASRSANSAAPARRPTSAASTASSAIAR
jgi:signal transduction histidine kinase